jgi:serine phosphatase RsbU (regulator of sigma subunit)/anti-sigma regulatory factor (Ser/Thr protein kinase)
MARPVLIGSGEEMAIEADQEELRLALHAAQVGAWTLDLRTGEMRTAGTYGQLLCGPGTADDFTFATFADFLRAVHPDDRAAVASSPFAILAQGGSFSNEVRILWPNGQVRWLASHGRVLADEDGRPAKVTGVLLDVTERHLADQERAALLAAEQAARTAAEESNRRLAQLQRVTEAGLAHLGVDELLVELLGRVEEALAVDAVVVWLVGDDDCLSVQAAVGIDRSALPGLSWEQSRRMIRRLSQGESPIVIQEATAGEAALEHLRAQDVRSLAVVPLVVEGRVTGLLQIGTRRARHFNRDELALLQLVADRMALAIDRARTYEHNHAIAETLQRSLLPDRLPQLPDAELAGQYLPGAGATVGGDWYDVLTVPDGEVALVMGDVVGRGVRAASVMGQLRSACRIYAAQGQGPASVVKCLNEFAYDLGSGEMATLVYLALDPSSGRGRFVGAGHPPPLVRAPDGSTAYLEAEAQLPLGAVRRAVYVEHPVQLDPGAMVVLYTDGLVERRDASLDEGLARLAEAVADAPAEPDGCCDFVLQRMLGGDRAGDDVALLALQRIEPRADPLSLRLQAGSQTLRSLRRSLRTWLRAAGADSDEAYDLTLAANEAAANAVEHAYGPVDAHYEVHATLDGGVVEIEVRDFGRWRPSRDSDRGRGLPLMEGLTHDLTVVRGEEGTLVRMRRRLGSASTARRRGDAGDEA